MKQNKIESETLRTQIRGRLVEPNDSDYEGLRKVYNAMIDRRPAAILLAADVADVMAAVGFARENDLLLAIRSGGHNVAGLGIADDALVLDLQGLRYTQIDPVARTVRVGAGCTWGDVDHATHPFGLAVPSGFISTTGVPGLTLGGGLGYLTRKWGLTIDNLISADVVLADGRMVRASAGENEDLFWALRGGGGNFGVVTSFLFRAHPVDTIYAGPMLWDLEKSGEVMKWYRDLILEAPEDLSGFFAFLVVPPGPPFPEPLHGKTMCGVVWSFTGPQEKAAKTFEPIRKFGPPSLDLVGPLPYPAFQSMFDALYPPGLQQYWKADFVRDLSDEAIDLHLKHGSKLPTPLSTMHLYPINGAAQRPGNDDTAWSYRDANWALNIVAVDPDPANKERMIGWARSYWEALHPYSAGGAYLNFMTEEEGEDRLRAAYRGNWDRLAKIKARYDPTNLFRVNQNIAPDGGSRPRA